jgi:hypothetical protein
VSISSVIHFLRQPDCIVQIGKDKSLLLLAPSLSCPVLVNRISDKPAAMGSIANVFDADFEIQLSLLWKDKGTREIIAVLSLRLRYSGINWHSGYIELNQQLD